LVTEAQARRLYVDEGMTHSEAAVVLGCSASAVKSALERAGIPSRRAVARPGKTAGTANPNWRGGRHKVNGTYITIYAPEHPAAGRDGYVAEHVALAYDRYGHAAPEGEVVHHVNMLKHDNRPENLVYVEKRKHHLMHRQLEQLIPSLMEQGIVEFDLEHGYHLPGSNPSPLVWDQERRCEQCGGAFVVRSPKSDFQRFCGQPCVAIWRRGRSRTRGEWRDPAKVML
jgi:hypothetical protein